MTFFLDAKETEPVRHFDHLDPTATMGDNRIADELSREAWRHEHDPWAHRLRLAWVTTFAEPSRVLIRDLAAEGWPYEQFTEHGADQALIRRFLIPFPPESPPDLGASAEELEAYDKWALGFIEGRGTEFDDRFNEQLIVAVGKHFLRMAELLRLAND